MAAPSLAQVRAGITDPTWSHRLDEARVAGSFCHMKTCLWGQAHCQGAGLLKGDLKPYQFAFVKNPCEVTQKPEQFIFLF